MFNNLAPFLPQVSAISRYNFRDANDLQTKTRLYYVQLFPPLN